MRGQTTLDFTIGVAVFIAVLLFAFTFVPGILEPFEIGGEEEPAVSDRVANTLSTDMLGSPENPNVLDRHCTVVFFDNSIDDSFDNCSFDDTAGEQQRLNLSNFQQVNVTIINSSSGNEVYCWTSSSSEPTVESGSANCGSGDSEFKIGDDPSTAQDTITARRIVYIGGEVATLRVVVW